MKQGQGALPACGAPRTHRRRRLRHEPRRSDCLCPRGADVAINDLPLEQADSAEVVALPLGRPGQPAELASIDMQLAASDATDATGPVYGASGGAGLP